MSGSIPCQAKTREVIGTGNIRNRTNRVSAQGVQTRRRSMVPRYRFHDSDSTTSGRFLHSPLQTRCSVSTSPRLARCLATLGRHARPVLDEVLLPLVVSSRCTGPCVDSIDRCSCGRCDCCVSPQVGYSRPLGQWACLLSPPRSSRIPAGTAIAAWVSRPVAQRKRTAIGTNSHDNGTRHLLCWMQHQRGAADDRMVLVDAGHTVAKGGSDV